MVVLEGYQARIRVQVQGYKVRIRRNGVNIYVPMGVPGPQGPEGPAGDAGARFVSLSGTSATFAAGTLIETVTIEPHTSARTILIGTTPGASDIDTLTVAANTPGVLRLDLYTTASTTLHFTGSPLEAKIYRSLP